MLETRIGTLQKQISEIDDEVDGIAEGHFTRRGPSSETVAELAIRVSAERSSYSWFKDRPRHFSHETSLTDEDFHKLAQARGRVGSLIDHSDVQLPSPQDIADPATICQWHEALIAAGSYNANVSSGPATMIAVAPEEVSAADALGDLLRDLLGHLVGHLGGGTKRLGHRALERVEDQVLHLAEDLVEAPHRIGTTRDFA